MTSHLSLLILMNYWNCADTVQPKKCYTLYKMEQTSSKSRRFDWCLELYSHNLLWNLQQFKKILNELALWTNLVYCHKVPKAPIMSGFYLKPGPSMDILSITISNSKILNCFVWRHWTNQLKSLLIKFIYSEKATKFCKIFTLLLTGTT